MAHLLALVLPSEIRQALTDLQLAFAFEWFRDFNPARAAERAGYVSAYSHTQGSRLLTHPGIIRAIDHLTGELAASRSFAPAWVRRKLAELHDISVAAVPVLDRSGKPTGEFRVDGATAARCLELLGKDQGMFASQLKVTHGGEVRHLLEAVSARGKPALEDRTRRPPQLLEGKAENVEPAPSNPQTTAQ
jgi:hypothetical protein